MKLRSFGCSFIYGSELASRNHTWPARIADRLELQHLNHGIEGAGNLRIMESILTHAGPDDICVINWTWIDRFDFVTVNNEQWHSMVPSDTHSRADFYYRNLHSQYRDMLTNLVYVKTALDHLSRLGARYLMTYMDGLMFETVYDSWHDSAAVTGLQQQIHAADSINRIINYGLAQHHITSNYTTLHYITSHHITSHHIKNKVLPGF